MASIRPPGLLSWLGVDRHSGCPRPVPSPDDRLGAITSSDTWASTRRLGTLADLDRLIAEARQQDMLVLLDLGCREPHQQRAPLVR